MSITKIERHAKIKMSSPHQHRPRTRPQAAHPAAIIQRARAAHESLSAADVLQLQRTIGNRAVGRLLAEINRIPSRQAPVQRQPEDEELLQGKMAVQRQEPEEEELLQGQFTGECIQCQAPEEEELMQGKFEPVQRQGPEEEEELLQGKFTSDCTQCQVSEEDELIHWKGLTLQEKAQPNRTGMPDHLKSGLENLSGLDLSGVRVQYSSSKPAQLNALAYTQGQEIHVAPGQEKHLPHEGWHAVQQMQGRVRPTGKVGGMLLNDSRTLESEADSMGRKALQQYARVEKPKENKSQPVANMVSQMQSGGESSFQSVDNRPEAIAQRNLQEMAINSPRVKQLRVIQEMANNSPQMKKLKQLKAIANNYSAPHMQKQCSVLEFVDNRPKAAAQRRISEIMNSSPYHAEQNRLVMMLRRTVQREEIGEENKTEQMKAEPIQRMISVNSRDLFYNMASLGFKDDKSKTKIQKEGEWKTNIEYATGLKPTDITADNFIGLKKMREWGEFTKGAVTQKLENYSKIFEYSDFELNSEDNFIQKLTSESIKNVLIPKDFITETSDIKGAYDVNLACVLQALINSGAGVPDFSGEPGSDDYKKFHSYMRKNEYASYDLDYVIYRLYTSLGLSLVVNSATNWENLVLPKGSYIFTRKGHNFAVNVLQNGDAPNKHVVDDRPQEFTTYLPKMEIIYVWKVK